MKHLLTTTVASIPLVLASVTYAQTTTPPATGAGATEVSAPMITSDTSKEKEMVRGWSVKDKVLGKNVYNENDEKVGDITDVILTSDGTIPYFVIGAGGFLGMGQHDVAIPFDKIQQSGDKLMLRGYTKDQLKALPQVELTK